MSGRANAFENLTDVPVFDVKSKAEKQLKQETVDEIASQNNFPSRQARKPQTTSGRKPRIYRTGRNRHFGIKATNETVERFYKLADVRKVTLGALLELALVALEKEGGSKPPDVE
jgi:hypothetical protein